MKGIIQTLVNDRDSAADLHYSTCPLCYCLLHHTLHIPLLQNFQEPIPFLRGNQLPKVRKSTVFLGRDLLPNSNQSEAMKYETLFSRFLSINTILGTCLLLTVTILGSDERMWQWGSHLTTLFIHILQVISYFSKQDKYLGDPTKFGLEQTANHVLEVRNNLF